MLGLVAACIVCAQAGEGESVDASAWRSRVESALQQDGQLLRLHEGYRQFLASGTEAASAERELNGFLQRPTFRRLFTNLEEQFANNPELEEAFNAYNAGLLSDRSLRSAEQVLANFGISNRTAGMASALQWMRGHPNEALSALNRTSGAAPPELRPVERVMQSDDALQEALLDALQALSDNPRATEFWSRVVGNPESAETMEAFEEHLLRFPEAYRAWQRRNVALADEPRTQEWNRYWRRLVQRDPDLARWYADYVEEELEEPEDEGAAAPATEDSWPPKGEPPRLTRIESPARPGIARPAAPRVDRPGRPSRPQPTRPTAPIAPQPRGNASP